MIAAKHRTIGHIDFRSAIGFHLHTDNVAGVDCALEVTEGTAKVFWISGSDEAVTLIETTGTYSDTITLPDGGNYIGIECESFTGSIELNIE